MQQEVWKTEPSLGELFNDLSRETKQLVRQEVELVMAPQRFRADAGGVGHLAADQPAAAQPQDR